MATYLQKVITANSGAKATFGSPISPPRKDVPNPQQGMADHAASISATTAATTSNTACTSPLTVTSLEAASPATAAATNSGVPQVVSQVMPAAAQQPAPIDATVEAMAKLGLNRTPQAAPSYPPAPMEEKKMRLRTPPNEHDNRKLFVGGLPTDVSDQYFLEFFQQFGDVIDSVVIIDRVTKRSRGFGFVTFSCEKFSNSILTAVPGKTGYVMIQGKRCEVKASTPKKDDGSFKHGTFKPGYHTARGMWRPDPPRQDNRGYSSHHPNNGPGPMKQKPFNKDNEYSEDVDRRNFDMAYTQQAQMNASYQHGPAHGRNFSTPNPPVYHQNYQNVYSSAAMNGYAYPNTSAESLPSSSEASYPAAPSQGYGRYVSNVMPGNGYYDAYGQQYSNQHGNNSMLPPMMMGQGGYAQHGGYYAEEGSPVPSPGMNASGDGGADPYAYPGDGAYDNSATADQYE